MRTGWSSPRTTREALWLVKLWRVCQVAGGTSFLWARADAQDTLDVLVVDEAAQMSLANVVAVSQAAHTLILLGDPQQLDQPSQAFTSRWNGYLIASAYPWAMTTQSA